MLAVLWPDKLTQYEFELLHNSSDGLLEIKEVLRAYPTTVYLAPFRVNLVPEVFTKPVEAGGGTVVVPGGAVVGGVVVGVAPGIH